LSRQSGDLTRLRQAAFQSHGEPGTTEAFSERAAWHAAFFAEATAASKVGNAFCDDQVDALLFSTMSTVVEIIDAVKRLDEKQKNEFLAKLAEIDFDDAWDRQIDADARAGRLDFLWEEAKRDIKEGRTRPLDELLGHE
jgi:hypothetical protein